MRAPLAAALSLAATAAPALAPAQRLVPAGVEARSMMLSFPPFEEDGALVAHGTDGGAPVLLRVEAGSVRLAPRAPPRAPAVEATVEAVACGGRRWLLEYDHPRTRYAARPDGGAEVWSHAFARSGFSRVQLRCAGARPVVGWEADGELVTAALAPTLERRTRLWPSGSGQLEWAARTPDELYAVFRPFSNAGATALVRIACGALAQRRELGVAGQPALAVAGDRVLVGWTTGPAPAVVLQAFAAADLAPSPALTVAQPNAHRSVTVRRLWPATNATAVVGLQTRWRGPEMLGSPEGPSREHPMEHAVGALHLWNTATGRAGPRLEFGAEDADAGAVVGGRFVLLEGGHVSGGVRVRRFEIAP